jgi:hypothetical protein
MLILRHRRTLLVVTLSAVLVWLPLSVSAHPGWGIRVDSEGEVFFSDVERNRVWKISRRGTLVPIIRGKHSHDLFMDQGDNLFGEHVYYEAATGRWISSQWQLTAKERLVELSAPTADPPRGTGILRDAAGNIFSVERDAQHMRLLKRAPDGQVTVLAGGERGHADGQGEQAKFTLVEAMVLGGDGALYARDGACIRRVQMDGTVTTVGDCPLAGIARGENLRILGLATDERGNVFVADTEQGVVRKIGADNRVTVAFETGRFWQPTGVTVVNGELYVLESLPESPVMVLAAVGIGPYLRVQKLSANGEVHTLATVWGQTTRVLFGMIILLAALFGLWRMRQREMAREVVG